MDVDRPMHDEITAEELQAEDVAALPNREAMSLITGGSAPLPIGDASAVPTAPEQAYPAAGTADDAAAAATDATAEYVPVAHTTSGGDTATSTGESNTLQTSTTATDTTES